MNNPEYLSIDGKKYKINTDYRTVFRFDELTKDTTISNYERVLGTICIFFGEEGINSPEHYERLLNGALNFVKGRPSSATEKESNQKTKKDMDYKKDFGLIVASMKSEYGIDIIKENIHWWTFYDYLNGLSSDCVLNRVREIRTKDLSREKDSKYKEDMMKLKQLYSLDETRELTKEEQESVEMFYKLTGIERKE